MAAETIIVVDDQEFVREGLRETLSRAGYTPVTCESGEEALTRLSEGDASVLITDLRMPGMSGLELLEKARRMEPDLPVIMVTAFATVENAVEAMKLGAFDYVMKPFKADSIEVVVAKAVAHRRLVAENEYLKGELSQRWDPANLVGESGVMSTLRSTIEQVAASEATVLIRGETGVGKEVVAGAIHGLGPRGDKPFIRVNCAALSAGLLESELFGHEKGAFTGADRRRVGRFELAEDGTILLDEISEMDLGLQGKLLRVLQEKEYERVGSSDTITTNARVLATSNRNLEHSIEAGEFRQDLFYRLNVVPVEIPPLRERKEDLEVLVNHFIARHSPGGTCKVSGIDTGAVELLGRYEWPGNVRELENIIERAIVLGASGSSDGLIRAEHIAPSLGMGGAAVAAPVEGAAPIVFEPRPLLEVEQEHIDRMLAHFDGHRQKTAVALGISERSLRDRLKRWKEAAGGEA
ncbi:MAG: sigma-54-dependent transcriptional regulator [Planctomycetota bacterium]|jgi:DNA-binding NtrC family response regulator